MTIASILKNPKDKLKFMKLTAKTVTGFENGKRVCLPTEHLKSAQELVQHVSVHSRSNWNLIVLVFEGRGKTGVPGEKPLGARRAPKNISTHI